MEGRRLGLATAVLLLTLVLPACTSPEAETSGVDVLVDITVAPPTSESSPAAEVVVVEEPEEATAVPPEPTEVPMLELPDLGPAPEIVNQTWLNADEPVTIASQRGKVILLEFWTFG